MPLHRRRPAPQRRREPTLTPAELRVAEVLACAATVKETARSLGVSVNTVRTHVKAIYLKLGIASRVELARWQWANEHLGSASGSEIAPGAPPDDRASHRVA